jgi:hypothetical protein
MESTFMMDFPHLMVNLQEGYEWHHQNHLISHLDSAILMGYAHE